VISKYLRRYTDLPALIYLLTERKITLLDPQSWDDSNDSHYLAIYREKKNLKSVLAVCFTQADETYHHWRVFAAGSGGVCIKFIRSKVLKAVKQQSDLRTGSVKYLKLAETRGKTLKVRDLPFLKRYAFEDEDEFRIIYKSKAKRLPKLDIDIPLSCIDRIMLSPWIHRDLADHVKRMIRSFQGCSGLKIVRSTLIGNEEWKNLGEDSA
jgi:hypothetical protein